MFLMKLEPKEKFSFLQLAHYIARIDNEFGLEEEEIILEYCTEMGIENDKDFDLEIFNLEETLKDFKSKKSKKIVILELMILIHADDKFDLKERALITKINGIFNFCHEDIEFLSQWGKGVTSFYSKGKLFIENN